MDYMNLLFKLYYMYVIVVVRVQKTYFLKAQLDGVFHWVLVFIAFIMFFFG